MRKHSISALAGLFLGAAVLGCDLPKPDPDRPTSLETRSAQISRLDSGSLHARADSIDTLYSDSVNSEQYFAVKNKRLLRLKSREELPDSSDAAVWVLLDAQHRPIRHIESPVSRSGDARISFAHYFDGAGRTYLFVADNSFFAPKECGSLVRDLRRQYFDSSGHVFSAERTVKDRSGTKRDTIGGCASPVFRSPAGAAESSYDALVRLGRAPRLDP